MVCANCNRDNNPADEICAYCGTLIQIIDRDDSFDSALQLMEDGDPACISFFIMSANSGNSLALLILGDLYNYGGTVDEDPAKAEFYYLKAVEKGRMLALARLGGMYFSGILGERKREKAFSCLTEYIKYYPYECGGLYDLGRCYRDGVGTSVDTEKAKTCFLKALEIEPENTEFLTGLGILLEQSNDLDCINKYKKAAELGDYNAALCLAYVFSKNKLVTQDDKNAIKYYDVAITLAEEAGDDETKYVAMNGKNILLAKKNVIDTEQRINQLLSEAFELLENGALSAAKERYDKVLSISPDNMEAVFFSTYITCSNADCDSSDTAISNMQKALNGILHKINESSVLTSQQVEFYRLVAVYSSRFVLNIAKIHSNKYEEMISYRTTYNRLGPVAFINNVMVPRYEKLSYLLYNYGDELEKAFPRGETKEASIIAWKYGNVPMEFCAEHGGLFERKDRKNRLKMYKRKANS